MLSSCVYCLYFEVLIEDVSRKVEVCSNQCADSIEDVGSVMVDSDVKLLCCASNILFVALLQVIKYTTLRDLHDNVCLIL